MVARLLRCEPCVGTPLAHPRFRDDVPPMLRALWVTLVRLAFAPLWWLRRLLKRPKPRWVRLELRSSSVEIATPAPWWARFTGDVRRTPTDLSRVAALVDALVADSERRGLLLVIEPGSWGWSGAEGLRESIAKLRAAGNETVAFLPRGGGPKELFIALGCAKIVVSPPSTLSVPGFGTSSLYLGAVLERIGIRFERFARSDFKSAYETLERSSMSAGQRTQVEAMLSAFADALGVAVATREGCSRGALEARGYFDAAWAKECGLVDAALYEDELPDFLGVPKAKSKDADRHSYVSAGRYLAYQEERFLPRFRRRPFVAVVPIRGIIGDSGRVGGIAGIVSAIRRAARDPLAKAIVLYVDTPGGSALGSDLIHREVVCAKGRKPVVAAFGNVAASGGYYVSAPAHAIVARRLSVTGSIGVIAARPDVSELLHRIGAVRESVGDAPHAGLFDLSAPLSDASRMAFDRELDASYARFVGIVAEGRGREAADIEPLARGRVYLGEAAHSLGLVDSLGGFPEACRRAAELARDIDPGVGTLEPHVIRPENGQVPPPLEPPVAAILRAFGGIFGEFRGSRFAYLDPLVLDIDPDRGDALETAAATGLSWAGGVLRSMRLMIFALTVIGISACGGTVSHRAPGAMPDGGTFHGVWFSAEYGDMHLCQSNNSVVGEYTKQERHGVIRGTVTGDTLRFQWSEDREFIPGRPVSTHGHGIFVVNRSEEWNATTGRMERTGDWAFTGEWGMEDDELGGGHWNGVMQPRESPTRCYDSIRRTVRPNSAPPTADEIHFADEQSAPSAP